MVGRHLKVGMCADPPTAQKGLWPRLATTAVRQAVGIYRSFLSAAEPLIAISTTPPILPFRRGGVLGGATKRRAKYLLITIY